MTYEELTTVIQILLDKGYVKREKPIWDMDLYQILNEVNKEY